MTAPKRIQRRRTKGWHMPDDAVYVGRPTRWGNPYLVTRMRDAVEGVLVWFVDDCRDRSALALASFGQGLDADPEWRARAVAVDAFRERIVPTLDLTPLAGRDLACWCPLDQPCHADVLLEIANGGAS